MNILQKTRQGITSVLTECIALIFISMDGRVPWYKKMELLVPVAYIVTPIDIIPDALFMFGHIDDIFVLRLSYYVLKKLVDQDVISENRKKAENFLNQRKERKLKFIIVVSIIWIAIVTLSIVYLIKKVYAWS